MFQRYSRSIQILSLISVGGCAGGLQGVPSPDYIDTSATATSGTTRLSVTDLVNHIECVIASDKGLQELATDNYVAQITLTLKVDDNVGLSPSVSFIKPYALAGTSLTYGINANLNADRQMRKQTGDGPHSCPFIARDFSHQIRRPCRDREPFPEQRPRSSWLRRAAV